MALNIQGNRGLLMYTRNQFLECTNDPFRVVLEERDLHFNLYNTWKEWGIAYQISWKNLFTKTHTHTHGQYAHRDIDKHTNNHTHNDIQAHKNRCTQRDTQREQNTHTQIHI